jgi:transcriptional regulator with XRE-family HTH domain
MLSVMAAEKKASLKNQETIGQRLARLRKEAGLSQQSFAEKLGISRSALADCERDRLRLHDNLLISIADVLNIYTDVILGLKSCKNYEGAPSLRLFKRLKEIEKLPEARKKMILRTLDDFIIASRHSNS